MSENSKTRFYCQICLAPVPKLDKETSNKFEEKMVELNKSISFMSLQFDKFNNKLDAALLDMNKLKSENDQIISDIIYLTKKILEINQKQDKIEQTNMDIGISIIGIPKMENENCISRYSKRNC